MVYTVSKSEFKPRALEFLRDVESHKATITITHFGKPVARVVPYNDHVKDDLAVLRDSIISYEDPFEPAVDPKEWEVLK